MKTRRNAGFTVIEVVLVLVLVIILLGLILPATTHRGTHGSRIQCTSNVKQIGLAFRMWANEHGEKFPIQLSIAEGGTKDLAMQGLPLASFRIISNELNSPKPLHCPDDKERKMATDFGRLTPNNLSYLLGLDASEVNPQSILSGDRNVCINGQPTNGFVQITNWSVVSWSTSIHNGQGNLGLADGSAHQVTATLLQKQLQATGLTINRFAIP